MKNGKWISVALASALLVTGFAGSVQTASAGQAAATAAVKANEGSAEWKVNGAAASFRTVDAGGYKLYALSQIASSINAELSVSPSGSYTITDSRGLHTLVIQAGQATYSADGETLAFASAPVIHNGKVYAELTAVVQALGGELFPESRLILDQARPEGEFDSLHWAADGTVLANRTDTDTPAIYKFGTESGRYALHSTDSRISGYAVSPDGRLGAFSDEKGQLSLIDLVGGRVKTLGKDSAVKTDFAWAADGQTLYYIAGDKQEKIAKVDLATGKTSDVLADKVDNKSELRVSEDGGKLIYIVNITGTAKNDADNTEESLTVDYSKAGEQLFQLDLGAKEAKPAALTAGPENKLYPEIQTDGTVVYLSADPEGNEANALKAIQGDKENRLSFNAEPFWMSQAGGRLYAAGIADDGSSVVYALAANGEASQIFRTAEQVSEIAVNADGSKLAVIIGGKLWIVQGGQTIQLTK